jgi:acetate kinase
MSRVLVVNSGSSSLKYQLIELTGELTLAKGLIERIGESAANVPDHTAAFRLMLDGLREQGIDPADPIAAIAHRVVHGGERFVEPTIVTDEVKQTIDELSVLAPLHNPPNLEGIVAAETTFPGIPQVAVFDTAFHQSLPPVAYTYAIDAAVAQQHGIRRFGFHGVSFQYVATAAAEFLQRSLGDLKLIVLHLGNGASACAIDGGRSVETSMGMTPLEGLMMGTRGGDIDPGVLLHLQREAGLTARNIDDLLNHRSGLLGLGGFGDIRDVQAAAASGDTEAQLAFDVYLHRIRSYVGSYLAQLGGADAIVFTAGVGENNAPVREGALAGLDALGIRIDAERNESAERAARHISTDDSVVTVLVIPTNEELEIARQALAVAGD